MRRLPGALAVVLLTTCSPAEQSPLAELTADKHEVFVVDVPLPALPEESSSYSWRLVAVPPNSTAVLENATTRTPYFTPDRGGDYVLVAAVSRGITTADIGDVVVTAVNRPPVPDAGEDRLARVGEQVALDGRGSSDPDGDLIFSYDWRLDERPSGSAAELVNPSWPQPILVPDSAGTYVLSLSVSDGEDESAQRDTIRVEASSPAFMLPEGIYDVVTAYSEPYDRLIVAGASGPLEATALVFDPEAGTGVWIDLPSRASDVSVSPGGRHVAFAHDEGVGLLDLDDNIYRLIPTALPWRSVAISDATTAYATRQYVSPPRTVFRVDLATGAHSETTSVSLADLVRHAPDHSALYTSGDDINKWDTSIDPPAHLYGGSASVSCVRMWMLGDDRLMTGSGELVSVSADPSADLLQLGDIAPALGCSLFSASQGNAAIAVVRGDWETRQVHFHDANDLTLRASLPPLAVNVDDEQHATQPDFIFLRGTRYMLVFELDRPATVARFGIAQGVVP